MGLQWSLVNHRQCKNYTTAGQSSQGSNLYIDIFNSMVVGNLGMLGLAAQIGIKLVVCIKYTLHMFHQN